MTKRRLPKPSELKQILRPKPIVLNPTDRRLAGAHTIADLRMLARKRTPRAAFDYTDGAAELEDSLRRARQAFRSVEFHPNVLRGVSDVDTGKEILGKRSELPFAFAPTGFTRMMNHEGESAVARVAQRNGIPMGLSTMATTSIEDLAAAAPEARKWFQLYVWRDHKAGEDLMNRAWAAGFDTLMLTVDTPVAGARLRDVRNGLTIPPALTLKTFVDGAMHPAWWFNLLTTEPLTFASLSQFDGTVAELLNQLFDPTLNFDDLDWVRQTWPGKLVVKGIQNVDDARDVVKHGADAVLLSNHGGRQLDRAPTPIELLPAVLDEIQGDAEVWVDTGILSGGDIVAAIARGADAVLIGRAFLYGLMAGGERGVQRCVDILRAEMVRTMQLLGVRTLADLKPSHATMR
ncbi:MULTISPECIES: alpha-hydroxy acid oxidase [Amycolatopsis]|uniref:L-lactate dehydrogenase (Cytochrome) n=3 Tax=Amycolatopsis TaxID=1813 RepID=R4SYJ4_9PSEU|nr:MULTISPECIES: alpha-hydroxy acid oxidase [Amycolatopsis]AGM08384.1 L-lactate dehydrogenase (cytochrome) [Amycolatopsis keratiniphila]EME55603.1 L-lactate dehydrogenase [Amycolatopsis decaplanina DSM 44594]KFU80545.1 lactate dehydrogenase [Amycolatopsis lurida NRRL 2430]QXV62618.1 alpha-hydroxy-acid oxidizing protein [Amycolatopsis sp. TNS106]RSN38724.1 alpha-hydroxy-acid oxidizing protein [Amycolatopsis sp. WAC 04197]